MRKTTIAMENINKKGKKKKCKKEKILYIAGNNKERGRQPDNCG